MIRRATKCLAIAVLGFAALSSVAQAASQCRICADDEQGLAENCCAEKCATKPACNSCCNKKKKLALAHKTKGGSGLMGKLTIEASYNVCKTDCVTEIN